MGDSRELLSDLVKVAPGCWFLWLLVPEGSDSWVLYGIGSLCLAVRVWQWLTAQQERQWTRPTRVVAVAALEEEVVVAAAEQVTTATAELTAAPAQVQVPMDLTAATAEVQAAADAGSSQYRQQRMQATEEWHKAAVAAEMAVEEQVAVEQAVSVVGGSRHRRRHWLRRRANGAPCSCVLESGRWINLPHARREAAGAIAVVQVRKQQRRCRFHDGSSGCRRSQCKYAPEGHAPAEDGADVLDPLVAAKLESLVGLMQVGLGRQQQEQLHQLQLQFQSVQPQPQQTALAAEMQAAVLV